MFQSRFPGSPTRARVQRCAGSVSFVVGLSLLAATFATPAAAASGDLDPSYGSGGVASRPTPGIDAGAYDLVLQTDGKTVATGYVGSPSVFAVERRNVDGSLDTSFGTNGLATADLSTRSDEVIGGSALQADGKVVAAGWATVSTSPWVYSSVMARFDADGTLDTTFGTGGWVEERFGTNDWFYDVAVQPDGKLVAAGYVEDTNGTHSVVARYLPDGSRDLSFNSTGHRVIISGTNDQALFGVAVDVDGRILAAGATDVAGTQEATLFRLMPDGSMDATFGTGGKVILDSTNGAGDLWSVVPVPGGKIVATGDMTTSGESDPVVVRLDADGSLDSPFGSGGVQHIATDPGGDWTTGLSVRADGSVVVSGGSSSLPRAAFAAAVTSSGAVDTGFAGDGVATLLPVSSGSSGLYASAVRPTGEIVLAGEAKLSANVEIPTVQLQGSVGPLVPPAPAGPAVSVTGNTATLSWSRPSIVGGPAILAYDVTVDGAAPTAVNGSTTSLEVTLDATLPHTFAISARYATGSGPAATTTSAATTTAPSTAPSSTIAPPSTVATTTSSPDSTSPANRVTVTGGPRRTTADPTPTVTFLVPAGTVRTMCAIDGGQATPCASPFTAPTLPPGVHRITITATDVRGASTTRTIEFTVTGQGQSLAITGFGSIPTGSLGLTLLGAGLVASASAIMTRRPEPRRRRR